MTNIEMITEMFKLQDTFNKSVNEDWKNANFGWKTAIFVETAEAIDSLGYKWWKHQVPDMENFKVELVDIWHFLMSDIMTKKEEILPELVEYFFENNIVASDNIKDLIKFNCLLNEANVEVYLEKFISILRYNEFTIESLYRAYVVKNCLNKFRQDNGYKTGEYIKNWNFNSTLIEDNAVAYSLIEENSSFEELYLALSKIYKLNFL
jgi:dimeric dUTPase (all-alpha-NTP-PPase superfamily)